MNHHEEKSALWAIILVIAAFLTFMSLLAFLLFLGYSYVPSVTRISQMRQPTVQDARPVPSEQTTFVVGFDPKGSR